MRRADSGAVFRGLSVNDNTMARPDYSNERPVAHYHVTASEAPPTTYAGRNFRRGGPHGGRRDGIISNDKTGGALMNIVILFVLTAGVVAAAAFLLYLWERDRTRRHGWRKVPRTIKERNVTSKRIAS